MTTGTVAGSLGQSLSYSSYHVPESSQLFTGIVSVTSWLSQTPSGACTTLLIQLAVQLRKI
jgi:hypothetical protein